jgi:hypothetical protein
MNPATASFEQWQDECAKYGVCILNDAKRRWPTQKQLDFEKKQRDDLRQMVAEREAARQKRQKYLIEQFQLDLSK